MTMTKEINEGNLRNNQPINLLFPVIFAANIKNVAGTAKIEARIANFSIFYYLILAIGEGFEPSLGGTF